MRHKSIVGLLFLHLLIVGLLAPSMGCAVYNFVEVDWKQTGLPARLIGSLAGGVLLQFFIWFITIPFAIVTMAICYCLCDMGYTRRIVWTLGGALLGAGYGLFFVFFAHLSVWLLVSAGIVIGVISSRILNYLWTEGLPEASNPGQ